MTVSEGSAVSPLPEELEIVEDLLVQLGAPTTLELLGMTTEDLQGFRSDSNLFETLGITREILFELRNSDVLAAFLQLPTTDQANFLRWIAMIDDSDLRRDRTATFIKALEESPLGSTRQTD